MARGQLGRDRIPGWCRGRWFGREEPRAARAWDFTAESIFSGRRWISGGIPVAGVVFFGGTAEFP